MKIYDLNSMASTSVEDYKEKKNIGKESKSKQIATD